MFTKKSRKLNYKKVFGIIRIGLGDGAYSNR